MRRPIRSYAKPWLYAAGARKSDILAEDPFDEDDLAAKCFESRFMPLYPAIDRWLRCNLVDDSNGVHNVKFLLLLISDRDEYINECIKARLY